jgi:hypothetical protein
MKLIRKIALIGLAALALKCCPRGEQFNAGKVDSFQTVSYNSGVDANGEGFYTPTPEILPGKPVRYFYEEITGDGRPENICIYEGGNVFSASNTSKTTQIKYERVMPGSEEASRLQKANPNLEIRAGN